VAGAGCPLVTDSVEKVENTAKTKFSQKLAGGRFLLRMRSSCEEEGRRKLLFKSTALNASAALKKPMIGQFLKEHPVYEKATNNARAAVRTVCNDARPCLARRNRAGLPYLDF
jgi:hypothetical protein